ncbi:hypothetical protein MHIP_05010 [Mycolicibacterium hippocampi]|uniref:Uncharacterized protein n=1 Tax=Mycolicibacterium hippocampi TaxID=659824 RepID=A0A7I9ZHD8_9MYCO|nr:hypothetical protein MHIP_05010 [Mycolicibacterium hippocampi]
MTDIGEAAPEHLRGLPLSLRRETRIVGHFTCSACPREEKFRWLYARCTAEGALLCNHCALQWHVGGRYVGWRLCRRCREPRWVGDERSQFTLSPVAYAINRTICDRCVSEDRRTVAVTTECAQCRNPFTAKRSDARFCSGRCRTAAHRAVTATSAQSGTSTRDSGGADDQ